MGALVLFPIFLLTLGVGGYVSIFFLFVVYRLTGGKRSFRSWFKTMQL